MSVLSCAVGAPRGTVEGTAGKPVTGGLPSCAVTVREVAGLLRVSTTSIYTLCREGRLEHHRVSNAIRISPRAVVEFVRASTSP